MALNDITFNRNKSGLGSPLLTKDHISGLVLFNDTLPSGFTAQANIKQVFSLEEVEALGITEGNSDHAVEWYHAREFFQKNPKGELYIGFFGVPADPAAHDFEEVYTMQIFAEGNLRQVGVYFGNVGGDVAANVPAIQAQVNTLQTEHKPLNVLFAYDIQGTLLTALPDLRTLASPNVSVTIGQDNSGKGAALYAEKTYSITDLGAKLGTVSKALVSQCIAWVEAFPMVTDGVEFAQPAFANGDDNRAVSTGLKNAVDDKGYLFLIKHVGIAGTYNNDSYTAEATTSDLSVIENDRTIDKAVRNVRTFLLPKLASPLFVNADGTLSADTIAVFKSLSDRGLAEMEAAGEVSAFRTIINEQQNVLATSKLEITIEIVPVGAARSIVVNIGFVPNLNG